jgi:transketolase
MPMALGMALAARIKQESYRVVALMSDGECNEGSIWESAMLAASQKVSNLAVVVDFNKWQATGRSQQVMALDPLRAKWEAFGWATDEIDGHDHRAITAALRPVENRNKPTAVIAHTVKGKGVSFMEDDNNWHYRTPSAEELDAALAELGIDPNVLGATP